MEMEHKDEKIIMMNKIRELEMLRLMDQQDLEMQASILIKSMLD